MVNLNQLYEKLGFVGRNISELSDFIPDKLKLEDAVVLYDQIMASSLKGDRFAASIYIETAIIYSLMNDNYDVAETLAKRTNTNFDKTLEKAIYMRFGFEPEVNGHPQLERRKMFYDSMQGNRLIEKYNKYDLAATIRELR